MKTYIQPQIRIASIRPCNMISASLFGSYGGSQLGNDYRGYGDEWDEEWDEDYE